MANVPLLANELTETQRVSLAALKQHPGFSVLESLLMAACRRATEEVIKLDPIEEGYERKLKALQSRARERNEFSSLILRSIEWQTQAVAPQEEDKKDNSEENRILKMPKLVSKGTQQ
jgi:hypothetical protein